jgi:5-methylcytosine-specific restriction endonuclease McrA
VCSARLQRRGAAIGCGERGLPAFGTSRDYELGGRSPWPPRIVIRLLAMSAFAFIPFADGGGGLCSSVGIGLLVLFLIGALGTIGQRTKSSQAAPLLQELSEVIIRRFLVQPCPRCQEQYMRLLEVSPTGRSVEYACLHCRKRMRALAGSPEAASAVGMHARIKKEFPHAVVQFQTVASPLPYQQTTREPIPEAVRSEVWRRDQGRCVKCGSNQQLEFDHIIPVSRGGATTVRNLQLLCRRCNSSKGASI